MAFHVNLNIGQIVCHLVIRLDFTFDVGREFFSILLKTISKTFKSGNEAFELVKRFNFRVIEFIDQWNGASRLFH
jgi:hypothetical protein